MTALLKGRRILIVEDEMLVLMNIEMALEDLGCSTIWAAASVAEALALLDRQTFDAAVIDVNFAGEKCYQVVDTLSGLGIPFAFSTGYGDHGDRPDLDDRSTLRKPYLRKHLVAMLSQLMPGAPPAAA